MGKKVLYNLDAVNKILEKQSKYVKPVVVWPIGDDKIRLLTDGIIVKRSRFNSSFERSRSFVQNLMIGCDYYYQIENVPETLYLREKLLNDRIAIDIDEKGIGTIIGPVNDDVLEYNPDEVVPVINDQAQKIVDLYEYNPMYEVPSFGTIYELINTNETINGTPIWRKEPKILQNESNIDYAIRALNKGVRTVVQLEESEIPSVVEELKKEGKLENLKEFVTIPGMKDNFIVESTPLRISKEVTKNL